MVVLPPFFFNKRRKLCFVINVLKVRVRVILLNLGEYRLMLTNSAYGLVG